jgi:hypothetical protein
MEKAIDVAGKNQLQVIIEEGNLEGTKAKYILDNFTGYFLVAAEWEKKAKMLSVTDPSQVTEMKMAREGRLFLREKRIDVEKARKRLKEEALREGQTIDAVAKVLTSLIKPIEDFLDRQEHFVERQKEEKETAMRLEIEKRMEDERIAKEKADAEEREKLRQENERLKIEGQEREKRAIAERKAADLKLAKERAKAREAQEAAEAERQAVEDKARAEREKREKALAVERAKVEKEKRLAEEKAQAEKAKERAKAEAERKEKERLAEILKNTITCPECGHKFQLKGK